jgi:ATP-binding cassette subfamily C protein LapB
MSMWTRFQYFQMSQKRFQNVFDLPLEHQQGQKLLLKGEITLNNLCFSYPQNTRTLFQNVSTTIRPGEFICVIGRGGSGKTTLCQLILGNIKPTSGEICFDGIPLNAINMPTFRKQVAYLAPRGEIFSGTVMDNITLFADHTKKEYAHLLARKVGLDRWVSTLPKGYDTPIGNQLDNDLPLGIQQRLCFVRALLLSPKILILDEANTNIDIVGDQELLTVLMELKKSMTIIFVTHRPSVARLADRIFEIRDETIMERMA